MRSASSLNLSPTYFSTCGRLTIVRLTFFLIGKPVSLLAKRRISSTDRNSSFASAGVIWWTVSTGSTSRRCEGVPCGCGFGLDCGVGDACGGTTEGGCCGVAAAGGMGCCDVDGVVCGKANDTKKMNGARRNLKERFL